VQSKDAVEVMTDVLKDPGHWRERAEETRTKAAHFVYDEQQKQRLQRVAAEYDQLADRAAQWRTVSQTERPPWSAGADK
jgi:hypothetical protein